MAGNIIHAIATTNAIISGLITVLALQMLAGCSDLCKVRSDKPAPCQGLYQGVSHLHVLCVQLQVQQ